MIKPTGNKILLLTPAYHAGVVESAGRWMPLSLAYLAGAARKAGFDPVIYDAMTKQHDLSDIEEMIRKTEPDYLGVSAITSTINASLDILRCTRQINPDIITILGGIHPSFCYEELFRETPELIDFIIHGEGEETLPHLLTNLASGEDYHSVPGIAFRENDQIIKTRPRPFIADLDHLTVAWDLLDWEDYHYFVIPDSRLAAIGTSRGCTHACTFCSQQKFWQNTWRARTPQSIVEEIIHLNSVYGVNVFLIVDEYPTKERERWEAFLDLLIEQQLDIYLLMETRVEDIVRDEDILHKYKKAGIIHIYIGVEATDQETLDIIKKELSVEQSKRAIDLIHSHGMITETSFVIGFPWDTRESVEKTLSLAQMYAPDFAHFLAITPWPYADMYDDIKDYIKVMDYSKYNLVEPIIEPETMNLSEVSELILHCYKNYYMKKAPDYFLQKDIFKRNYLKRSMKLIMKNSFLTSLIVSTDKENDFAGMHRLYAEDQSQ